MFYVIQNFSDLSGPFSCLRAKKSCLNYFRYGISVQQSGRQILIIPDRLDHQ